MSETSTVIGVCLLVIIFACAGAFISGFFASSETTDNSPKSNPPSQSKPIQLSPVQEDKAFLAEYEKSQMRINTALDALNAQDYVTLTKTATNDYYLFMGMQVSDKLVEVKNYYLVSLQDFIEAGALFEEGHKQIESGNALIGSNMLKEAGGYLKSAIAKRAYSQAYLKEYKS